MGDEIGGLDMETRREREYLKLPNMLQCLPCFSGRLAWQVPRKKLLELGPGISGCMRRKVEEEDLCDVLRMKIERRGAWQLVCFRDGVTQGLNLEVSWGGYD